jgi:hypothetical protein
MSKTNWRIIGLVGAVLFVSLVVIILVTQERKSEENRPVPEDERSLAHQLAIADAGRYVPEDHGTVEEFEELLASLDEATSSSKEEIKTQSTESVTELEENYDVEVTILEFMNRAKELASESDPRITYVEIATKVKVILSQEKTEA